MTPTHARLMDLVWAVADPGFPMGGGGTEPLGGTDMGAFRRKCIRKRKNWVPFIFGGAVFTNDGR